MNRHLWMVAALLSLLFSSAPAAAQHSSRGALGGHTFLSYDATHGVQIEYMDKNGRAFLWYPEEKRVMKGVWRLKAPNEICFAYPGHASSEKLGVGLDGWICMTMRSFYDTTLAKRPDDPFSLASGDVPFVISKGAFFRRV